MDRFTIISTTLTFVMVFAQAYGQGTRALDTYTSHYCTRPCDVNRPMNCYYDFHMELYFTLSKACYDCPFNKTDCFRPHCVSTDGVSREIIVINRMLPGPGIHVCQGDTVIVNVANYLKNGAGTSIHWHGILQHGSQHMDGTGMVTQCPITTQSSFEYRFNAANPGTHFWHTHSGMQRSDGAFGAFVVRQAPEFESHLGLYDEDLPEHTILVNDWLVEMSSDRFAHHHQADGDNKPRSMLINGRGLLQKFFNNTDNTTNYTPVEIFRVNSGRRFRFRTISNGIFNCPIQISIDNHTLTMIASDGNPFDKIDVESFNIFAGERYDFVLNASQPIGNYWIRTRGLADCAVKHAKQGLTANSMDPNESARMRRLIWIHAGRKGTRSFLRDANHVNMNQVAILRYDGANDEDPAGSITWEDADRMGKKLNPWNKNGDENNIPVTELKSRLDGGLALKTNPDKRFYLAMDFNKIDNYHFHDMSFYPISAVEKAQHLYMPQMNHVSLTLPPSPPLTQYSDLDEEIFCNNGIVGSRNCSEEFCECVHRLQVQINDTVELVVIDEGVTFNANHPMHLHGHTFYVVALDRVDVSTSVEDIKQLDREGKLLRNLVDPVAKDTVTVPDGGYSILRFHADNPGVWFFHCHIEFHMNIGMGLLIQVGDKEDWPRVPKNFPKCGHWKFQGYEAEDPEDERCMTSDCPSLATQFSFMFGVAIAVVMIWM